MGVIKTGVKSGMNLQERYQDQKLRGVVSGELIRFFFQKDNTLDTFEMLGEIETKVNYEKEFLVPLQ